MKDSIDVTARTVTEWAEGTLFEWLPGIVWDEKSEQEYRVTQTHDDEVLVESLHGSKEPRSFRIYLVVREC